MRMGGTKEQLSKMPVVSTSFIYLFNVKSNPSLQIMERIADALDKPLTEFLEETDLDSQSLEALAGGKLRGIVEGYKRISLNTAVSSSLHYPTMDKGKGGHEETEETKSCNEINPRKPRNKK